MRSRTATGHTYTISPAGVTSMNRNHRPASVCQAPDIAGKIAFCHVIVHFTSFDSRTDFACITRRAPTLPAVASDLTEKIVPPMPDECVRMTSRRCGEWRNPVLVTTADVHHSPVMSSSCSSTNGANTSPARIVGDERLKNDSFVCITSVNLADEAGIDLTGHCVHDRRTRLNQLISSAGVSILISTDNEFYSATALNNSKEQCRQA